VFGSGTGVVWCVGASLAVRALERDDGVFLSESMAADTKLLRGLLIVGVSCM
jgi:hypothetical protein